MSRFRHLVLHLNCILFNQVADVEKDVSSYCVQRLREDSEYMFRVTAENPVGVSEALESETITVRSKFGKLGMVLKLLPHQQ
jgi:hypothetical protein